MRTASPHPASLYVFNMTSPSVSVECWDEKEEFERANLIDFQLWTHSILDFQRTACRTNKGRMVRPFHRLVAWNSSQLENKQVDMTDCVHLDEIAPLVDMTDLRSRRVYSWLDNKLAVMGCAEVPHSKKFRKSFHSLWRRFPDKTSSTLLIVSTKNLEALETRLNCSKFQLEIKLRKNFDNCDGNFFKSRAIKI